MAEEKKLCDLCGPDEIWVCAACGKTQEYDRYQFPDVSCFLNSFKVKKSKVIYEDNDPTKRVVSIDRTEEDLNGSETNTSS